MGTGCSNIRKNKVDEETMVAPQISCGVKQKKSNQSRDELTSESAGDYTESLTAEETVSTDTVIPHIPISKASAKLIRAKKSPLKKFLNIFKWKKKRWPPDEENPFGYDMDSDKEEEYEEDPSSQGDELDKPNFKESRSMSEEEGGVTGPSCVEEQSSHYDVGSQSQPYVVPSTYYSAVNVSQTPNLNVTAEQHGLCYISQQDDRYLHPSQKSPQEDWERHYLNVELVYDGRRLNAAEKSWIEKQITGLVNILLESGSIPQHLSVTGDHIDGHNYATEEAGVSRNSGRQYQYADRGITPHVSHSPREIKREMEARNSLVFGDGFDEEFDLSYDPYGYKQQKAEQQERRDTRQKYEHVIHELGERISRENVILPSEVSSDNSYITVREGFSDKDLDGQNIRRGQELINRSEIALTAPAAATMMKPLSFVHSVHVSEVACSDQTNYKKVDFHSKSDPFIKVQESSVRNPPTSESIKCSPRRSTDQSGQREQYTTTSASSPHVFQLESQPHLTEKKHEIISTIEEKSEYMQNQSNNVQYQDRSTPERNRQASNMNRRSPESLSSSMSSSSTTNTVLVFPGKKLQDDRNMGQISPSEKHKSKREVVKEQVNNRAKERSLHLPGPLTSAPISRMSEITRLPRFYENESLTQANGKLPATLKSSIKSATKIAKLDSKVKVQSSVTRSVRMARSHASPYPQLPKDHIATPQRDSAPRPPNVLPLMGRISPRPTSSSTSGQESIDMPQIRFTQHEKKFQVRVNMSDNTSSGTSISVPEMTKVPKISNHRVSFKSPEPEIRATGLSIHDPRKRSGRAKQVKKRDTPQNLVPLMRTPQNKTRRELRREEQARLPIVIEETADDDDSDKDYKEVQTSPQEPPSVTSSEQASEYFVGSPPVLNENMDERNDQNPMMTSPRPKVIHSNLNVAKPVNRPLLPQFQPGNNSPISRKSAPLQHQRESMKRQQRVTFDDNPYVTHTRNQPGPVSSFNQVQQQQFSVAPPRWSPAQSQPVPMTQHTPVGYTAQTFNPPNTNASFNEMEARRLYQEHLNMANRTQIYQSPVSNIQPQYHSTPYLSASKIQIDGCQFPNIQNSPNARQFQLYSSTPMINNSGFQYQVPQSSAFIPANNQVIQQQPTFPFQKDVGPMSPPMGATSTQSTSQDMLHYPPVLNSLNLTNRSNSADAICMPSNDLKSSRSQNHLQPSPLTKSANALDGSQSAQKSRRWRQCLRERDEGEAWWMPEDWAKQRGIGSYRKQFEKDKQEEKDKELQIVKDANIEQIRMSRFISW